MAMDKLVSLPAKVVHFWRLEGPQLPERPEDEPRVKLPAELAVEAPEVPVKLLKGQAFPEAPFQIGPHQRVVRHET
eukprot:572117-Amphidinium_carterae.2